MTPSDVRPVKTVGKSVAAAIEGHVASFCTSAWRPVDVITATKDVVQLKRELAVHQPVQLHYFLFEALLSVERWLVAEECRTILDFATRHAVEIERFKRPSEGWLAGKVNDDLNQYVAWYTALHRTQSGICDPSIVPFMEDGVRAAMTGHRTHWLIGLFSVGYVALSTWRASRETRSPAARTDCRNESFYGMALQSDSRFLAYSLE